QELSEFETDIAAAQNAMDALLDDLNDAASFIDLNRDEHIKIKAGDGSDEDDYRAVLQEIQDKDGNVIGEYAYIIVDEQSKLNPSIHTGQPRVDYGQTAAEIPITTGNGSLLDAIEQNGFQAFFDVFQAVKSPFSIGQAFSSSERSQDRRHLFGYYSAPNQDIIPAPYTDASQPKYNINTLATDTSLFPTATERAENIGSIIDTNLTQFKDRDAGTPSTDRIKYLNRIGASIVDYIDADVEPTTVNAGEVAGKDLHPMVTSIGEYFRWVSESGTDPYTATVETRMYVQIWNPYTTTVTSDTAGITMGNRKKVYYGTGIVTPFPTYSKSITTTIQLRPNEYTVLEFPMETYTFASPSGPNIVRVDINSDGEIDDDDPDPRIRWFSSPSESADDTNHPYIEFSWNNTVVDSTRRTPVPPLNIFPGITRNSKSLNLDEIHYQINYMQVRSGRSVGDPRFNNLTAYDWGSPLSSSDSYRNSTYWFGRNPRDVDPYNQNYTETWVNRDYIRADPVAGVRPRSINDSPSSLSSNYDENIDAANSPFYIRNGSLKSITELGHIFDPAFADDSGNAPFSISADSNQVAGGGRTLRIGQPEFSYWDNDGERAIELLNLFTTSAVPTGETYPEFAGRININTAPKEVLDALFYQIQITSDEGAINSASPPIPDLSRTQAYNGKNLTLSEIVIEMREQEGPFRKLSDLHRLIPFFATAGAYSPPLGAGSSTDAPEVMDRAREEFFAKFINLVTLRSNNFRVHVLARSLSPIGTVLATTRGETLVELYPETNSSGILTINPVIAYEMYQ
ncbi:MAG: hypothetical protein AAF571_13480, partial [Verrucomicrobiota bacterium]